MDSIGARLKSARLEKKLTIDEVYKKTKIHPEVLLAIEEDRFSQLSPVYLKGFLKIYSRFLGMNPQEIVEGFQEPKTIVETVDLSRRSGIPPEAGREKDEEKIEAVIKGPAFKFNFSLFKSYLKIAGIILAAIISLWLLFKIGKFTVTRIKAVAHAIATRPKRAAKPSEKIEKVQTKIKPAVKPVVKPVVKPEVKSIVKPVVAVKPVSSQVELSIRAKEDCYIYLKSDGKTVFQGVLKKGYAEAWAAKDKMELTVGNAGGIELNVNGNPLPPLGKRKQAIKNIIITKEGLST
jgi:cytoskeleton protein RodZ